jgi:hypothetical protein
MKPVFEVWIVRQNTDLTEGRGRMVDKAYYPNEPAAKKGLDTTTGVMGTDSGKEIILRSYFLEPGNTDYTVIDEPVWGYVSIGGGHWHYGWRDGRDLPQQDPEWEEYVRLAKKFKDAIK